jgi:hypothetical protein
VQAKPRGRAHEADSAGVGESGSETTEVGDDRQTPHVSDCGRRWATRDAVGPEEKLGWAAVVRRRSSGGDEGATADFSAGPNEGRSRPDLVGASGRGVEMRGGNEHRLLGSKQNEPVIGEGKEGK